VSTTPYVSVYVAEQTRSVYVYATVQSLFDTLALLIKITFLFVFLCQIMIKNGEKIPSVHKRWFKIHMFCGQVCWSEARMRYYEGKVRFITFYFTEFLHFGRRPFDSHSANSGFDSHSANSVFDSHSANSGFDHLITFFRKLWLVV
jgi:hypothetical protein